MEKGYFAAAWGDVTKSPGWASVVLRLGLLCLIPIFGVVVMYGYLFSWARDIAWNVHRPLPRKIFANEDGSLYRRGFFIFVVALVFSFVPELVNLFIGMSAGFSFGGTALYGSYVPALFGSMIWLAGNSASAALYFIHIIWILHCVFIIIPCTRKRIGRIYFGSLPTRYLLCTSYFDTAYVLGDKRYSLCTTDCRCTFCDYYNIYGITFTPGIRCDKAKISI